MGAALRRERDPGRRADQDRLAARVDPERPRLQRALDERVVEHPDRQQRLPPPAPGGAQLAEQPDEVRLGDAQLEVLAGRGARASAGSSRGRRRTSRPARGPPTRRPCSPSRRGWSTSETSGASVTTRVAASGAERVRSSSARPSAAWVVACRTGCGRCRWAPRAVRRPRPGRGAGGRRSRAQRGRGRAVGEPAPTGRRCRSPSRSASSANCSVVSSDEWFCGWPSVARPWPLTVYAKITVGRVSSMAVNASRRASRSWPPRLRIAACRVASSRLSTSARSPVSPLDSSPGSRSRSWAAVQRSRRWYSGLDISSMRRRRASPPGRANSSCSSRPYLTVSTCQPAAANMPCSRMAPRMGTTRSRLCRLRSTIQTHLAQLADHRVEDRLPAGALVQLGVADAGSTAGPCRRPRTGPCSAGPARPRSAPSRRCRPSRWSSRPGPGPSRGSGSSAGRRTSRRVLQVRRRQLAEQVVDRVQHR